MIQSRTISKIHYTITSPYRGSRDGVVSAKEKDEETSYSYFGARYLASDFSFWLSVDPMSDDAPGWTPYRYCFQNPINLTDPDGLSEGDPDWVGTKNEDGTKTWKWEESITSKEQAVKAGYDDYSKPGKIITKVGGEKVRLGENGQIQYGIIGINSNVGPNSGLTDGHAWISVLNIEGKLQNTYSLWPDKHPLFANQDKKGTNTDVRTNTEINAGYATNPNNYSYFKYLSKSQIMKFNGYKNTFDTWSNTHNCADWSRDAFNAATGIRLDVDDYFGFETPRKLSRTIINLKIK